ncbi:MAG: alpha/beta hydrolase [Hyphomicrobiales bacterium]|nr:alpha/beta hydrolase [Hyphomicrobiales bacterium]
MPDRRPVAFADVFGWFRPGRRRLAVVLCPAFGLEGLTARRGFGELADALARAGLPTLSFDWPGTGDALGDDRDPDRLDRWRAGLGAAIEEAKRLAGADRVALVGLRLGATLAVAASRDDVVEMILLAPVVSGRTYVREQKSLARLLRVRGDDDPPDADEIGGWSVGGFFTSDATGAALAEIDLRRAPPPAGPIAIFHRDADAAASALANDWRAAGATVDEAVFADVDAFLSDPTVTRTPAATWDAVVDRLAARAASFEKSAASFDDAAAASEPPEPAPARLDAGVFVEEAHLFGPDDRLFGVVARPATPRPDAPFVILLPGGRNPHVGWGRGGVELARALAAEGHRVLRMDQAGVGDSRSDPDGPAEVLYADAPIADVSAAMDRFAERPDERFVLIGPCSGAHLAWRAGLADRRVVAVATVNLQRFEWRAGDGLEAAMRGEFRSSSAYAGLIRRADTWKRLFGGEIRVGSIAIELLRRIAARVVAKLRRRFVVDPALRDLRGLAARGVRVLFVFGTDDGGRDEFAEHLGPEDRLGRLASTARLVLIERTDHNLSPRDARRRLEEIVIGFLNER